MIFNPNLICHQIKTVMFPPETFKLFLNVVNRRSVRELLNYLLVLYSKNLAEKPIGILSWKKWHG